jgi:hypothetical protein
MKTSGNLPLNFMGDFVKTFVAIVLALSAIGSVGSASNWYGDVAYLKCNEDVRIALLNKQIASAYDHWRNHGQYEGRLTDGKCYAWDAPRWFDEAEYLRCNPDVRTHIGLGLRSGWHHYRQFGKYEGRQLTCGGKNGGNNHGGGIGRDDQDGRDRRDDRDGNGRGDRGGNNSRRRRP